MRYEFYDSQEVASRIHCGNVAEKLGKDEEWLWELQIDMVPEDGCLWGYSVGQDGVPAFTDYGIECLPRFISPCSGSYRPVRGGVLVQPTVGQFEAKPRWSRVHATSDSPRYRMP